MFNSTEPAKGLALKLFGPFEALFAGNKLPPFRSRSGQWLLGMLALQQGQAIDRDEAAGLLWPESTQEQSLANLRRTLTDIRSALGPAADRLSAPTSRSLALKLHQDDNCDHHNVLEWLASSDPHQVELAINAAEQQLLPGCEVPAVSDARVEIEARIVQAVERSAELQMATGNAEQAIPMLRRVTTRSPLEEGAQRLLIRALAFTGNRAAAILAYRNLRLLLFRELRTEPDPETTSLYEQIRNEVLTPAVSQGLNSSATKAGTDTPSTLRSRRLPRPLTPLVGRLNEVSSIEFEVQNGRLVTLLGPGGIGKTRLSVEVATRLETSFRDGVCFADLSGITAAEMVPGFIAECLGLQGEPSADPLRRLCDGLADRQLLLVLDNCEHLIQACATCVSAMLDSCEHLHVLSTSREALGIGGERRWLVPALASPRLPSTGPGRPAPQLAEIADLDALAQFDAVRLFEERARAALPSFRLSADNAHSVAAVCARLDGIPLAIELAAARLNVLTASQIEARLSNRFTLLTGGSRNAWPRHQTLAALIEWSYDLLTEPEKELFRQLSVFSSGWDVETLTSVVAPTNSADPIDLMSSLLDKSLIFEAESHSADNRRFSMLESLRDFAAARLQETREQEGAFSRHIAYFMEVAEKASAALVGPEREQWIRRIDAEADNIRAALSRGLASDTERTSAVEIACSMVRYWYARNQYSEGKHWLEYCLDTIPEMTDSQQARAANGAGSFCWAMGEYDCATRYYERHLEIRRQQNDPLGLGYALQNLGLVAMHQGDYVRARKLMEESLPLLREYGEPGVLATPLNNIAIVAKDMGEFEYAQRMLDESLQLHQNAGNRPGQASVLIALGNLHRRQNNMEAAREAMLRSLELMEDTGDLQGQSIVLHNLGEMAQSDGRYVEAETLCLRSLTLSRQLQDRRQAATTLFHLSQLARLRSDFDTWSRLINESTEMAIHMRDQMLLTILVLDGAERFAQQGRGDTAAMLFGSAVAAKERMEIPWSDSMLRSCDALGDAIRGLFGGTSWSETAAGADGRDMSLEEAAAVASAH